MKRGFEKRVFLFLTIIVLIMLLMGVSPIFVEATSPTLVGIIPTNLIVSAGQTFTLNVSCTPGQPIKSYEFKVSFNPTLLQANSVTEGNIFNGYTTFFNAGIIDNTAGTIVDVYGLILGTGNVSSTGNCAYISFTAHLVSGASTVGLYDVGVTNETSYVPITVTNGSVVLREFTLNITINGSGSVTKNPDQATYMYGTIVQLTATANSGYALNSWSGDLSGSQNPTSITMDGNKSVTAHFVDIMPPRISGINRSTSKPLDTDPSYGWVNVSCIVTDNVAVSQVILRIHNPGGSWNNVSMITRTTGKYYYRTTTAFSTVGNYSYSIWAKDTSNNVNTSSYVLFSMPPNWDVNIDGYCTILDLVLISNHYRQSGSNGWIREDADNNGEIKLSDLVYVSDFFGESWW